MDIWATCRFGSRRSAERPVGQIGTMMSSLQTFLSNNVGAALAVVGSTEILAELRTQYPQAVFLGRYDPVGDQQGEDLWKIEALEAAQCRGLVIARQLIAYRSEFEALRARSKQNGWQLWTPQGKDLSAALEHGTERSLEAFSVTRETVQRAIDVHDTISFDIFDTLLQRCTLSPGDVFELVELRAKAQGLPAEDFSACRKVAQLDSGLDNPDLDEIYRMYQKRYQITQEQAEALKALEIETESKVLRARDEMVAVFRYAKQQGKRVVLTSDMYLPAQILEPILAREGFSGYDALLISCEKKCLKLDGLFTVLKQTAQGSILHIGDHRIHDGICAELAGLDYLLLPSQEQCLTRCGLAEEAAALHGQSERGLLGQGIAMAFSSPFGTHITEQGFRPDAHQLTALYFAPMVAVFLEWLAAKLRETPRDGILFAARDGAPMLRWYNEMRAAHPDWNLPEGHYFYTSRRAATLCGLDDEATINAVIDSSRILPPDVMLRQKFALSPEQIIPPKEEDGTEIYRYVWQHRDAIFARARSARQAYFRYMGKLGLKMGGRYAFYDFVSSGTSQKNLAKFVPFTLDGLYFACTGVDETQTVQVEAFLGTEADYFLHQFKRLELFMTSDEGSLATLDADGSPVFAQDQRSEAAMEYIHVCQQTVTDWLRSYFGTLFCPQEAELKAETVLPLFEAMRRADLSGFAALELTDDWNGQGESLAVYCEETPESVRPETVSQSEDNAAWKAFCKTTPMRSSLLNWYGIASGSTAIVVGDSPLVELLCQRCAEVTVIEKSPLQADAMRHRCVAFNNLHWVHGRFPEVRPEKRADIVLVPGLERCAAKDVSGFLAAAREVLAPGGRLLIVLHNRFGLKYFCGVPVRDGQPPFAGLEDAEAFSRAGIQELLAKVGLSACKFYYPMPDARLPQAIYTDAYQPSDGLRDRVIPYYDDRGTLIAAEDKLWDEILRNGMLPFFANDFLVEAHDGTGNFDDTIFAALSTDRGARDGFVTAIHADRRVTKTAIAPEGCETLQRLYATQRELESHGVGTVPCTYADGCLTMPFVEAKNLVSLLSELAHKGQGELFAELIEGLWQQILRSSPQVPTQACALPLSQEACRKAGPILAQACIDMIPFNCFYTQGQYLFYDQEFVRENYPASYVLFRALRYTYGFAPDAQSVLPLQKLKDRYGLTEELWSAYEREEGRFVEANRNYREYAEFYRHAGVDSATIEANRKRLQDYGRALPEQYTEAEYRNVLLNLLRQFDTVCRRYDLHYTLYYGTLLGAVRHNGFVPWDDDIDVIMPRADYDRLCALPQDEWPEQLFLQTPETDPACFYGGYAKLRDGSTTGIELRNIGHACNQGIWIDIMPLDACWSDKSRRLDQMARIREIQTVLLARVYPERHHVDEAAVALRYAHADHAELCARLHAVLTECDEEDAPLTVLARNLRVKDHVLTRADDWCWTIPHKFEDMNCPIPMAYDRLLSQLYGPDYLIYPPVPQRTAHHRALFDPRVPYERYQAEHATLLSFFSNL